MFYVSVIQYYFDKTKIWLKIASKGAYVAPQTLLSPCRESGAGTGLLLLLPPGWHLCFILIPYFLFIYKSICLFHGLT